jgi:hypothetical protein
MSQTADQPKPPAKAKHAPGKAGPDAASLPATAAAEPEPVARVTPVVPRAAELPAEPGMAKAAPAPRLPRDELNTLAEDYGLDSTRFDTRAQVVQALADRKALIGTLDRTAMLEVVRWGRRPVSVAANREQLALEIARIRRMKFDGLSREGLFVLGLLRGVDCSSEDTTEELVRKLRRKEGLFSKLNRRRRSIIGSLAAKIVGEDEVDEPYRYLTPADDPNVKSPAAKSPAPPPRLREQIEERGLFGGLADRVRRSADSYVNTKLDEIELRIDRKLDEIDKRLAEWRDKEIANRVRILKFTLWASVIVSIISLIYAYFTRQVF